MSTDAVKPVKFLMACLRKMASTTEAWIHNCYQQKKDYVVLFDADEESPMEAYQTLLNLTESPLDDNMKVLSALFCAKNKKLRLVGSSTHKKVRLDVLRKKNVLLLISDLDHFYDEDLSIVKRLYQESHQNPPTSESQFEVVWMPIVDEGTTSWTEETQQQFETLQGMMPWYFVNKPSLLDPQVIKFVKEKWKFKNRLMVVVINSQGTVVNPNALHMIRIWGTLAFPLTHTREESLWREESRRIELLADTLHPHLPTWIEEEKCICLYGGEDLDWIRRFTLTAKAVAQAKGIPLEMLYVGKSNPNRKVVRNIAAITAENLSHTSQDIHQIRFFWLRLQSMWYSKIKHGGRVLTDPLVQDLLAILNFNVGDHVWAAISNGSNIVAEVRGETVLKCFGAYYSWGGNVNQKDFILALSDLIRSMQTLDRDHHTDITIITGIDPEEQSGSLVCADCGIRFKVERFDELVDHFPFLIS